MSVCVMCDGEGRRPIINTGSTGTRPSDHACPACDATGVEPDPCATCDDTGSLPIEMDQYGRPVDHYDCPDCTVARRVTRLVRQAKRREMH